MVGRIAETDEEVRSFVGQAKQRDKEAQHAGGLPCPRRQGAQNIQCLATVRAKKDQEQHQKGTSQHLHDQRLWKLVFQITQTQS
jgi:hypothetical protein